MKRTLAQKLFSVLASLSIILQSIYPGALLLSRPAFAEDATPSADTTVTPEATPAADTTIATESATPATNSATTESTPSVEATPEAKPSTDTNPTNSTPAVAGDSTPSANVQTQNNTVHGDLSATVVKNAKASSLDLNLDSQTAGSATISTDKADYSPTDTVVVTGSNFIPNQTYQLEISSTDPPAVNFSTSIITDSTGSFIYAYQLDGNYRPNYKIEVKDASGAVVAATTFTDSGTRTINSATLNGGSSANVLGGTSVAVSISVTTTGSDSDDDWESTSWSTNGVNYTCVNHSDHTSAGIFSEIFNITAPSSGGTYSVSFKAHKDDSCGSSGASVVFTLSNALVVTSWPTSWTTPSQCSVDGSDESPDEVDLIGTPGSPAVGFSSDASYQFFREKVDGNPGTASNLDEKAWVVLLQTSAPQYQYLASLNGHDDKVQLWQNTVNAPDSGGVDFSPLFNDPADSVVWEGSSASYARVTSAGGGEYYLDWAIPLTELTSRGITPATTKFFATSSDANNFNKDHLNCYEAMADVSVVKSDNPDPVTSGGTLTYTLSIHNGGPDTASSVIATDTLPAGYAVTSVTPSQGSCSDTSAPSIQCELGSITNGANATVTIVGTMTGSGMVTNNASISSSTLDTNQGNNSDSEDTTINVATGTITIIKDAQPNDPQDFAFTTTGSGLSSFGLDDDSDAALSNTKTFTGIAAGSYSVTEGATSGWTLSNINCVDPTQNSTVNGATATINLAAGETVTCTYTNTKLATLTVKKHVVNDNGGQATAGNFMLHVKSNGTDVANSPQAGSEAGNVYTLSSGTYVVSEDAPPAGYTQIGFSGDCGSQGSVTLGAGDNKTCTITNDDIQPKLTVTKVVTNDNGGTKTISDFPLFVDQTSVTSGAQNGFNAGTYTISETQQAGYSGPSFGGNCSPQGQVTLSVGDVKSCTITNDDVAPSLTLVKEVSNNDGGQAQPSDWTLTASGPTGFSGAGPSVSNGASFDAGTYNLSESGPANYSASSWVCDGGNQTDGDTVIVGLGDQVTCTITNDDNSPNLKLVKNVIYDNGGTAVAHDWTLTATSNDDPGFSDFGDSPTFHPVKANTGYVLSESEVSGYTSGNWSCNEGTLNGNTLTMALGQHVTCTITNDDVSPHLIVIKHVINDNGGTAVAGNFTMKVDATNVSQSEFTGAEDPGTELTLDAGGYSVSENQLPGYTANYSDDCEGTIEVGETKTCTITNNDDVPSLTLVKTVTNDNGGQAVASAWTLTATGPTSISGAGRVTSDATFAAGTYTLSESAGPSGYTAGSWTCLGGTQNGSSITVGSGENVTCTITNDDQPGQIKIIKNTVGGDDVFGFTVSGPTPLTPSVTTSGNTGNTGFLTVNAGSYSIVETVPSGWDLTSSSCDSGTPGNFTVLNGGTVTCTFTDTKRGHIIIKKNAVPDSSQAFTFNNDFGNGNPATFNLTDDSTPGLPSYDAEVLPGTYSVSEGSVAGWQSPESATCDDQSPVGAISVQPGETVTCTFTNEKLAKITLVKNTVGGDGTFDFDAAGAGLPADIDLTTSGGTASQIFENLDPDNTYSISENVPDGWDLTDSNCTGTNTPASITPNAGEEITCTFTNANNPILTISKSNDASGDKHPGDSVTFTITVSNTQGTAYNVHVVDLPAGGFTYRAGSWTGTTTEPTYASPGNWSLGTMTAGQTITLTYIADISGGQQAGLYKDLAWASGCKINPDGDCSTKNTFLASTVAPGIVTGTFVGTQVNVVKDQGSTTHVNIEGQVLGATTYLPATGGRTIWVVLASLLVGLGALLMALGRSKLVKGILPALAVGIALFTFAPQAQAANVSVRIEAPKSPTNQDSFNVNFVTLDTLGRDITVKCFKQAPGDGSPSQFGSDIVLSGGGNSGNCVVNNGVISAQGTYQFSVTAQAGADPVESSNTVSVEYKTINGPDTPVSYTKEQNSSCQFKIKFKTANDGGRTVRVEVYRSTTTSFAIDDSTKVGSVGIGSNADGSLANDVPDCGKTYYYAIRAYDSAGNGSGVIGDSVTTTIPGPVLPAPAGAIPVSGGTGTGAVLGGESSSTETGGILGETTPSAETKELPSEKPATLLGLPVLPGILGLLVLLVAAYVFYRRGKQV